MRAVEFDTRKARYLRASGRENKIVAKLLDFYGRQPPRARFDMIGRPDHFWRVSGIGSHAGMMKLYRRNRASSSDTVRQAREPFDMLVRKDAELAAKSLSARLDVRGASHRECKAARRAEEEAPTVIIGYHAIRVTLLTREGSKDKTISKRRSPRKRQWLEEFLGLAFIEPRVRRGKSGQYFGTLPGVCKKACTLARPGPPVFKRSA